MKHLLASLVTAGFMVGVAIAQEDSITSVTPQLSGKDTSCYPNCANPGPHGQSGVEKGDRYPHYDVQMIQKESSNSESDKNDTSTKKIRPFEPF